MSFELWLLYLAAAVGVTLAPGPNGLKYDIISLGADGKEGGSGNDADIKLSDIMNE